MISGVLYALLAGLMWGLIFVGPLIVPEYPAVLQSMGRYLALGLIALPIAWLGRVRLRQLGRKDWVTALTLTMMGNLIYYVCLASAIQRTGAPVSTMIIGTLPVVIPVFANLLYSQRDGKLSWWRLSPALVLIGIGLLCVNISELNQGLPDFSGWRYGSGIALALISVVCWAWYALRNARWLRENTDKHPMMWATAQALVTLPVLAAAFLLSKPMAAYQMGEEYARSVGVNVRLFSAVLVLLSSLLAACVTAFAGPISFVGIAVPHLVKQLLGSARPLYVLPGCCLGGAAFCLLCDLIARSLFAPMELSISAVTAVFGAPVVIGLLLRRNREDVR